MVWKILRNQAGFAWLKGATGVDATGFAYATYYADEETRTVELFANREESCEPLVFELDLV